MSRIISLFFTRDKGYYLPRNVQRRVYSKIRASETEVEEDTCNLNKAKSVNVKSIIKETSASETETQIISHGGPSLSTFIEVNRLQETEEPLSMVHQYSNNRAIQLLKYLAMKNIRSVKIIKALSEKICVHREKLNFMNCSDIFFSWARLSFKNKDFADALAEEVMKLTVPTMPPCLSIIRSIGILQYRNCDLIDKLVYNMIKLKISDTSYEYITALHTMAVVNYLSSHGKSILKALLENEGTQFSDAKSYLNFVWSCVLLNELSEYHISQVLSPQFQDLISTLSVTLGDNSNLFLKLQNINGAVTLSLPSYSGPVLKTRGYIPSYSKSRSLFLSSVVDALCHLSAKRGFLKTLTDIGAGFALDVECYFDAAGLPSNYSENAVHKIGILLLEFNDFCLDKNSTMTGLSSFKKRILEAKGYKVITIPYYEFNDPLKTDGKVKYLQKKIDECLK